MKIFLTGGTGFIGSHILPALLQEGHEVICSVRSASSVTFLKSIDRSLTVVDIQDEGPLLNALDYCEIVIHLAGQMGKYGLKYDTFYNTNCTFTEKLLLLSDKCNVNQFIFCSTPGVYGFGKRLCSENTPYAPRNDYEKTKVIAEQIIKDFCENSFIKYTILRPDFVYGPGDVRRAKLYKSIKEKRFILTTSGKSYLHPTHIDDIKQTFIQCIGKANAMNQIFNVAAENDITAKDYLSTIADYTGSKLIHINLGYAISAMSASMIDNFTKFLFNMEGFVTKNKIDFLSLDHSSNIEKAKKLLSYHPIYNFSSGIPTALNWCEKNGLL
jgi:UDP-glucose 4-epimerase